jgi:hypothetical protein
MTIHGPFGLSKASSHATIRRAWKEADLSTLKNDHLQVKHHSFDQLKIAPYKPPETWQISP